MEKKKGKIKEEDDRVAILEKANEDLLVLAESLGQAIFTKADSPLLEWLMDYKAITESVLEDFDKTTTVNSKLAVLTIAFLNKSKVMRKILAGLYEGMK